MSGHDQPNTPAGLRGRIITPAPPAPVPKVRKHDNAAAASHIDRSTLKTTNAPSGAAVIQPALQPHSASETKREPAHLASEAQPTAAQTATTSNENVVQTSGSMAIATLISRITGFLRNVFITATLGGAIASAFNTANTLPNLITEIVLGAVLSSLVIPVLIRAEKEDPDRGEAFIRRLFTLAVTILGTVTVVSVVTAPWLIRITLDSEGQVNIPQAVGFAYWLLPQIFFYGIFALFMAILNTKDVFKPGAWAPVVNNIIVLLVMGSYWLLPGHLDPDAAGSLWNPHMMLLGIGTTAGVVAQALILLPYIKRANISLRPLWGIDQRLKQFGGMAAAIIVYVAISQLGLIVTTRIASQADEAAPIIYSQAWLLLQVPYGIIGVTVLTAIMPRLSRHAAEGDDKAVIRDLVQGSKLTYIALVPIAVFFTIFGTWIARGLFAYGQFNGPEATILGWTLSFEAFTLLPYAMVLLHLRIFYAREQAWTPTYIIAGITTTKICLSMLAPLAATSPSRVVILLGAANGFGFVAGAVIGSQLLRRKLGDLQTKEVAYTSLWALAASAIGGLTAWVISVLADFFAGEYFDALGSVGYLVQTSIAGVIFLIVTGLVLSRSGLEEVLLVGQTLRRLPGFSRLIPPLEQDQPQGLSNKDMVLESTYIDDTFNSTPVPPPMSAGVVRGPRLVPGAEVSDGNFRLLVDHGSVPGAHFWRARNKETGKDVALTFVDTSGLPPLAPRTPAEAQEIADTIAQRTLALQNLGSAAIPSGMEVRAYRNGCLVVTDWVHGSPLSRIIGDDVDATAATLAFAPLIEATETTTLGIDNRARIRISTDGVAVLAFPAVLEEDSHERDLKSLRSALNCVISKETAPKALLPLLTDEPLNLLDNLRAYLHPKSDTELLEEAAAWTVKDQTVPVKIRPQGTGFGRKGYSRIATSVVLVGATSLVITAALITAYLTSLFSKSEQAPLKPDTIAAVSTEPSTPPVILQPVETQGWKESNASAQSGTDNNLETEWVALAGQGLLLNLASEHQLEALEIITDTPGFKVHVFGTAKENSITSESLLNDLLAKNILVEANLEHPRNIIPLKAPTQVQQVLVVIESLEGEALYTHIKEIKLIGRL